MLTRLIVRNFKSFHEVEVELGNLVVLIGPNNSGKTTGLQALALWEVGLRRWNEKRKGQATPERRPGVAINRRDMIAVPVPNANLLWRNLRVRDVRRDVSRGTTQQTTNIRIDIIVEGISGGREWKCGLEFDYANDESFYCRPIRLTDGKTPERMPIPDEAASVHVAFLPPMSGLAASETRLDLGAINVRVGEGRTAEVLRNLCYEVYVEDRNRWRLIREQIHSLFGAKLDAPEYIPERGEIVMSYQEDGARLDLSSSGRGLQQTLLLLSYMYANPGAVLLLDEPDAHLEILRQRQTYQLLTDVARENDNQIVAASHSEVILNEASRRDVVIAFLGKPHRVDDRGSQVLKSLNEIGFEHYYQAEQTGWVLYLEGPTDLAILRAFAKKLEHREAMKALERPFVHYVGNQPRQVRRHYWGVREAYPSLRGTALFDRLDQALPQDLGACGLMWVKREIENYLCHPETLQAYVVDTARQDSLGPLFVPDITQRRIQALDEAVREIENALVTLGKGSPWDPDTKVSDDFLNPLFETYHKKLGLPNVMAKSNFHELALFVPPDLIDPEVGEKLDAIAAEWGQAKPTTDGEQP